MSDHKVEATFHPDDSWNQWSTAYVGGGQGEGVYLAVHRACGAFIADRDRHLAVCTAPPWEPAPVNIGETQDFLADGTIEKRTS